MENYKELSMKTGWHEITLSDWRELKSIQSETEIGTLIERISILTDMDPSEIRQMPLKEFNSLVESISWISTEPRNDVITRFNLDGIEYGMIPDLNFISTGEFVDIENWKKDSEDNIHNICALLFRPVIWEEGPLWRIEGHKPEGFTRRADLFLKKLPITYVWGALLFFSTFGTEFIGILADYLKETGAEMKTKEIQTPLKKGRSRNSKKRGDGTA